MRDRLTTELRTRPRQSRSEATVARILQAVGDILAQSSIDDLTMTAIGEKAGVRAGTVYHYFPNKNAAVHAFCTAAYADIGARIVDTLPENIERLQWPRAVDVAIDSILEAYLADTRYRSLSRAVTENPRLGATARAADSHIAEALADMPFFRPHIRGRKKRYRIAMAVQQLTGGMLDWFFSVEDPTERDAVRVELKRAIRSYLTNFLPEPALSGPQKPRPAVPRKRSPGSSTSASKPPRSSGR